MDVVLSRAGAHGDKVRQWLDHLNLYQKDRDTLIEQSSQYISGKPLMPMLQL